MNSTRMNRWFLALVAGCIMAITVGVTNGGAASASYPPSGSPTVTLRDPYALIGGAWFVDVVGAAVGTSITTERSCVGADDPQLGATTVASVAGQTLIVAAPDFVTDCELRVELEAYGLVVTFDALSTFAIGPPPTPPSTAVPTTESPATTVPAATTAPDTTAVSTTTTASSTTTSIDPGADLPSAGAEHIGRWSVLAVVLLAAGAALVKISQSR